MKIFTRSLAFSLMIFSSALCHAALQNGKVQVAITKGESSLTNPQSIKEPAVKGKLFEQGYKVETSKDSTLELCFSNGSTVLVNPDTLLEIRTFRQVASNLIIEGAYQKLDKEPSPSVVEIFIVRGKIIGEARKLNPQSSFTIKSPAGVARIRGTVYSVQYSKNKTTRTGNMEVACVKGSVEVTINGSDSGSVPVEPGRKMNAQAPITDEDEKPAELKKVVTRVAITDKKVIILKDTTGLKPGMKIQGAGIPEDVEIVSINPETGEVTLTKSITVEAGVEITPLPSTKKVETKLPIIDQKNVEMANTEGLRPGMKVQGAGLPPDLEIVAVDPVTHVVTFNKPVTVEAGVEIKPIFDFEPITVPLISFSRLSPDDIGDIARSLSNGTSVPSKLTDDIQKIADNTQPVKPGENNEPEPSPSPNNNGGVKDFTDQINKTIQDTIEKETQKNPSPSGG
jgi:hypothetical protein